MKIKNTTGKGSLGAGISFHFLDGSAGGLGIGEGMGLGDGHGGGVGRVRTPDFMRSMGRASGDSRQFFVSEPKQANGRICNLRRCSITGRVTIRGAECRHYTQP